jgi:hypothetical protein
MSPDFRRWIGFRPGEADEEKLYESAFHQDENWWSPVDGLVLSGGLTDAFLLVSSGRFLGRSCSVLGRQPSVLLKQLVIPGSEPEVSFAKSRTVPS